MYKKVVFKKKVTVNSFHCVNVNKGSKIKKKNQHIKSLNENNFTLNLDKLYASSLFFHFNNNLNANYCCSIQGNYNIYENNNKI